MVGSISIISIQRIEYARKQVSVDGKVYLIWQVTLHDSDGLSNLLTIGIDSQELFASLPGEVRRGVGQESSGSTRIASYESEVLESDAA
jgi:hypothetical protein